MSEEKRQIKEIKREQKKDGAESFLVVYEGDENDKGKWVPESDIPPELITAFRAKKKNANKARKIKEIKGIIPQGDDIKSALFVVRFRDGSKDEGVAHSVMHSQYAKELLKYYESNIERIPVKTEPSQPQIQAPATSQV